MNLNAPPPEEPASELLSRFLTEARLQELLRIEEECGCDIGAGRDWGPQLGAFMQNPEGMEELAQLRDWMLQEFHLMLMEWNLGIVTNTVYSKARSLLIERFRQPSIETQEQLWHLFEQAQVVRTETSSAATAQAIEIRTGVQRLMVQTLSEEDWQALTQAAVSTLEQFLYSQRTEMHRAE